MREVWPGLFLAFPLAIYVGAVTVASVPSSEDLLTAMFVVLLGLALVAAVPEERLHTASSVALLGVTAGVVGVLFAAPAIGVDLLAASLLATPALILTYCVRPGSLGWRLFGFGVALTDGVGLLAADGALNAVGTPISGAGFVREFVSLNVVQLEGLAGVLNSTGGLLPLRDFFDPIFVVLAAVAAVGLFVPSLRPQSAWGEMFSTAFSSAPPPSSEGPILGLGAALETALRQRSVPQPALTGVAPGLLPLVGGCGVGALLVVLAFLSPGASLVLVTVGILLALSVTIAVMRRPLPAGHGR